MEDVTKQDRSCPKQQPAPTLVPTLVIISAEIMNANETAEMNCTVDRLGLLPVSFAWLIRKMAARHDNGARNSTRSEEVNPTTEAYVNFCDMSQGLRRSRCLIRPGIPDKMRR